MRPYLLLWLLTASAISSAQVYTVESVPNVKLVNNSYISNPDNVLSYAAVDSINSLLRALERETTAQVAVVVLNSIGDADVADFAQELFVKWGVGVAGKDNGALILLAMEQRRIRFQTGDGLEGVLPDVTCKRIQTERMVPFMQQGRYDEAVLNGLVAVIDIIRDPASSDFSGSGDDGEIDLKQIAMWLLIAWCVVILIIFLVRNSNNAFRIPGKMFPAPRARFTKAAWIIWYFVLPVAVVAVLALSDNAFLFFGGIYGYVAALLLMRRNLVDREAARWALKKEYQTVYNFFQQEKSLFSGLRVLFPIPFAFMYGNFRKRMQYFRDHPRDCRQCGRPLVKLDEASDDAFLSKSQLLEEAIKSVDYDVWKCSSCNAADRLSYINPSSKYSACPKCKVVAYFEVSNSVIRAATTTSEGTGERIHSCKYCGHRDVTRYVIARVESSSSSSSSSSSGGSWGGGSSGGGGASSSW